MKKELTLEAASMIISSTKILFEKKYGAKIHINMKLHCSKSGNVLYLKARNQKTDKVVEKGLAMTAITEAEDQPSFFTNELANLVNEIIPEEE